MDKINVGRVFLGGLAAGIVSVAMQGLALALGGAHSMANMLGLADASLKRFAVLAVCELFIGGPAAIWFYAAIRPRFGAGAKTALIAGAWIWLILGPYASAVLFGLNVIPTSAVTGWIIGDVLGFVPIEIAMVAGAWMYQEEPMATAKGAA